MEKFLEDHPILCAIIAAPILYFLLIVVMSF
jgi:hypothetical protein